MGDAAGGLTLQAPAADDAPLDTPPPSPRPRPRPSCWRFWRSPADQPGWARPVLLAIAVLAALSYTWGINNASLETFYAAAVRSMSQSWHNFFFGAFDPWGTVTVDKLPGAFWVQALSVRVFGFHVWSVVLPQAIEGVLTVLVLYRAVRRVAGASAGLVAAAVLAATPVTILLNRGNISDSLLILLLVLAADATVSAFTTGRLVHLLVAGAWVGLAFQAKMLQAWIVLPALYLAYLLAAPAPSLSRRLGHVALSALVALGVSLSWMLVVTVVPAHDRPYADGSCNNSVFSQVFLYNGADRLTGNTLDQPGCSPVPASVDGTTSAHPETVAVPRGPGRFLNGTFGTDSDWMLLPAAVALVGIVIARRREPRTDPVRAATLLWAAWLFLTWSFFASSHFINSYYLAALAPPIAALCGMGLALAWRLRARRATRVVVLGTVTAGTAYVLYLLPAAGVRSWVVASTLALALAAVALTAWSLLRPCPRWAAGAGLGLAACALFLGSAWASATAVASELGPFDSPYQPAALTARNAAADARSAVVAGGLKRAAAGVAPTVSVITSETSSGSSIPILDTGREFLPVGGFTGRVPSPTLPQFIDDVRRGRVAVVLAAVAPRTRNPDMLWAIAHCRPVRYNGPDSHIAGRTMRFYACSPADAGG